MKDTPPKKPKPPIPPEGHLKITKLLKHFTETFLDLW